MVRVVGRRPGKQMTPFEFVLIFFIGGLTLTFVVGDEASFISALGQIMTIAIMHYLISWIRTKSSAFARLTDGTPLVLLEKGQWRPVAMKGMRIADDDVMAAARDKEIKAFDEIEYAVLALYLFIKIPFSPQHQAEEARYIPHAIIVFAHVPNHAEDIYYRALQRSQMDLRIFPTGMFSNTSKATDPSKELE